MASIARYTRTFKKELIAGQRNPLGPDARSVHVACRQTGYQWKRCFWTPAQTLLTFLVQVLLPSASCRAAVAHTLVRETAGRKGLAISGDPSAYSHARQRLPLAVIEQLTHRHAQTLRRRATAVRRWCGRRVVVADGTTVSMPDTAALQEAFPQPAGQRPGCGFPMARVVVLFCWSSGVVIDLVADALRWQELPLFRRLRHRLNAGDVVLGDRAYCSYFDLATLRNRGVDAVFRLHISRPTDLRRGQRLGKHDRRLTWTRPTRRPPSVTPEEWTRVPRALAVRLVRVAVVARGRRTKLIHLVTTLYDPQTYSRSALAELYADRWHAELNLRCLKTTLGMDILRCKSPAMVQKELMVYMLAYNLVRALMWQAAERTVQDPLRLSFAGAAQRLTAWLLSSPPRRRGHLEWLLLDLAKDLLPKRPGRQEPRILKRRPRANFPVLTHPRQTCAHYRRAPTAA